MSLVVSGGYNRFSATGRGGAAGIVLRDVLAAELPAPRNPGPAEPAPQSQQLSWKINDEPGPQQQYALQDNTDAPAPRFGAAMIPAVPVELLATGDMSNAEPAPRELALLAGGRLGLVLDDGWWLLDSESHSEGAAQSSAEPGAAWRVAVAADFQHELMRPRFVSPGTITLLAAAGVTIAVFGGIEAARRCGTLGACLGCDCCLGEDDEYEENGGAGGQGWFGTGTGGSNGGGLRIGELGMLKEKKWRGRRRRRISSGRIAEYCKAPESTDVAPAATTRATQGSETYCGECSHSNGTVTSGRVGERQYQQQEEEEEQCAVCLSEFETGEDVTVLPCKHAYHTPCIRQWLGQHTTCPLCKRSVRAALRRQAMAQARRERLCCGLWGACCPEYEYEYEDEEEDEGGVNEIEMVEAAGAGRPEGTSVDNDGVIGGSTGGNRGNSRTGGGDAGAVDGVGLPGYRGGYSYSIRREGSNGVEDMAARETSASAVGSSSRAGGATVVRRDTEGREASEPNGILV